jgi:hypothetical protein
MAYVPKDAEWFLAELVEEFRVQGDKRNTIEAFLPVRRRRGRPDYTSKEIMDMIEERMNR